MREGVFVDRPRARLIAFYLPQYHPIPENDAWWGKGFTEWTNVARAKPLFRGHYQPRIPADLGFYDLRVPETREAQAEMAREHGIEGFCYWHYWFAGKRLLERPFSEVLRTGEPDFPFCLAWANQSWTGIWHGAPNRVLIQQTYPGKQDYEAHFRELLPAFTDHRYLTVDGKPLFVVFVPNDLPEPREFVDCWRECAAKAGLEGLYLVGQAGIDWIPEQHGFDASVLGNLSPIFGACQQGAWAVFHRICKRLVGVTLADIYRRLLSRPVVISYKDFIKYATPPLREDLVQHPCVFPSWDHTPRTGARGVVLHGAAPELFREHLRNALAQVALCAPQHRIVFIKSWNEWAEGNYLEPDQRHGMAYLEAVRHEVSAE